MVKILYFSKLFLTLYDILGAINVKFLVNLAKERLEGVQPLDLNKSNHELGDKMDSITRKQKKKEIQSLYPENGNELPENLEYKASNETNANEPDALEDKPLMSMGQALEHDVCIDTKRMIDPEVGTGGLYEFMPATQIKGMEDWIPESEHYRYYQTTTDFPLHIEPETDFIFPEHLSLYTYEMGNCSEFRRPSKCLTGKMFFYFISFSKL